MPLYWDECQHEDGREAIQWPEGSCSDPELQELLKDEARARRAVRQGQKEHWEFVLLKAILRLLQRFSRARQVGSIG